MTDSTDGGDPKENADVPPTLPNERPSTSDAGGVLSPEDLDFTDSPYVAEIEDGRYVVSADRSPPNVPGKNDSLPTRSESAGRPQARSESPSEPEARFDVDQSPSDAGTPRGGGYGYQSPEEARSVLASELERVDARFAIDIISRFDGRTVRHRTASDDVVGTFDSLILWYAQNVSKNTPTERAASLLLAHSEFTAGLSPSQIRAAASEHGLTKSSTIEELLEALE
ncbi:flagella cluster protein [Natrialbaceae archaeon GCM10025810]|uniref:DUF7500 family protein n=1 Tax=Halovalidus salilacus TaxID=3075124 RepID=UPI003618F81A